MIPPLDAETNRACFDRLNRVLTEELEAVLLRRAREAQGWTWKPGIASRDEQIACGMAGVLLRHALKMLRAAGYNGARLGPFVQQCWEELASTPSRRDPSDPPR
jgi:hypothetical protein